MRKSYHSSKGQWFIISAVMATGVFLAISGLFKTYNMIDTSENARMSEDYYFSNVREQFNSVVAQTPCTSDNTVLSRNLREFKAFSEKSMAEMGYLLYLNYSLTGCTVSGNGILLASSRMAICQNVRVADVLPNVSLTCGSVSVSGGGGSSPLFMTVNGGRLMLGSNTYFIKGANYVGGRYISQFVFDGTYEQYNSFQIFHDYNEAAIESELQLMKNRLGINTIRLLTPTRGWMQANVQYHGWDPWFNADGTINPLYLNRIKAISAVAERNGIKIQLELLHNVQLWEMTGNDLAGPGSANETFFSNYVRSVVSQLRDDDNIISYEIGNEMLVNSNVNYWTENWYDREVISFIRRMIGVIRANDPNHLITTSEYVGPMYAPYTTAWWWPSAEFVNIADVDNLNGGTPYSLYSLVDYVSPHFYYNVTTDLNAAVDAVRLRSTKPVVMGEFGYQTTGVTVMPDLALQSNYFSNLVTYSRTSGLSGYQAWAPMPVFVLRPGTYSIGSVNPVSGYPIITLNGPPIRLIDYYDRRWELLDYNLQVTPAGAVFFAS
jgi:hypothetical protein